MAKIPLFMGESGNSPTAPVTSYVGITNGPSSQLATETQTYLTYRFGGTLSGLLVVVSANTLTQTITMRSRVNVANGNQSVTFLTTVTGTAEDVTNSDTIAAGDEVAHQSTVGGTGAITWRNVRYHFAATTNTAHSWGCFNVPTYTTASTTNYLPLNGNPAIDTTEANNQESMEASGTLKNMCIAFRSNGSTNGTDVRSRVNGANGNIIVSVAGGVTTLSEDSSNSDSYVAGDLVNTSVTTSTGTVSFRMGMLALGNETTNSTFYIAATNRNVALSAGTTYYLQLGGSYGATTTEALVSVAPGVAFTGSNMQCYVQADTVVGDSTMRTRIGGSNGNQVVTITGLSTGKYEDTSNSDSFTTTDLANYSLVTGAAGTSLTFGSYSMLGTIPVTSQIKTFLGLANASTKVVDGLAIASLKTWAGLTNV